MLEVQDMRLSFSRYRTLLRREWLPVLNGVSVSVQRCGQKPTGARRAWHFAQHHKIKRLHAV